MENSNPQQYGQVFVSHPLGLHARPSVKITKLAKQFQAVIMISKDNGANWVDAKSIVKVMGMKVKVGQTLKVKANGSDAKDAIKELMKIFKKILSEQ